MQVAPCVIFVNFITIRALVRLKNSNCHARPLLSQLRVLFGTFGQTPQWGLL